MNLGFLNALLSLSLLASPAVAGPAEVPKLNPQLGTGLPGPTVTPVSSNDGTASVEAVVPTLGGGTLIIPESHAFSPEAAPKVAVNKSPVSPVISGPQLGIVSPEGKIVPKRRIDSAEKKKEKKAEAPEVGSKEMKETLRDMAKGASQVQELLDDKKGGPSNLKQAGLVSSVLFDSAKKIPAGNSNPTATPIIPRRKGTLSNGLKPAPGGKTAQVPEESLPAPGKDDAHLRKDSRSKHHSSVNIFLGKALYYATGGSFGVHPKTFGQNDQGEPLIVLERMAFPFSMLLPRKLRHAIFGRHWLSVGINDAPDMETKRALIKAFKELGKDDNLDELKTGWAGGPAGFRSITSNPGLTSFAARHADDGWQVLPYRTNAKLTDRLTAWLQHPIGSPILLGRQLWAGLQGRAPPEDPRRIVQWTDPDPEPANRLPLYVLKLPFRFAGAVVSEIIGDAANRHYTARALGSIPIGLDRFFRKVIPFYRYLPELGMTSKRLRARFEKIALEDPKRVIGMIDGKDIECQKASDCAVRATYNHPAAEAVREAMDYKSFLNFAEAAVNTPLRDTGTTLERRRTYMKLLGFDNGSMEYMETEDELIESLNEKGPLFGRMHFFGSRLGSLITFSGWNPSSSHLVVVNGAIREKGLPWMWRAARNEGLFRTFWKFATNPVTTVKRLYNDGVWIFLVTDSNFNRAQRYTFRQLEMMELHTGTLTRTKKWELGIGFRTTRPEETEAKIKKAKAKYADVKVPRSPGFWKSFKRLLVGPRWKVLPSDGPVLVPAKKRIGIEIAGRPWKGGKHLEIVRVDIAKKRFKKIAEHADLAVKGVTHVIVDPLNPKQFQVLRKDGGEVRIGRGGAHRFLLSEKVSRSHLSIISMGDHFIIQDHDSSNGTRISRVKPKPVDVSLSNPTTRNPIAKKEKKEIADKDPSDGDSSDGAGFLTRGRARRGTTFLSMLGSLFQSRREGDLRAEEIFGHPSKAGHIRKHRTAGPNPGHGVGFGHIGGKPYYFKMPLNETGVKFTPALIEHEAAVGEKAYEVFERGLLPDTVEVVRTVKRTITLRATGRYPGIELGKTKGDLVEAEALVSEPAPGILLDEFHGAGEKLTDAEISALEEAVTALHKNGVAHGDLSGANLAVMNDPANWSHRVLTLFDFDMGAVEGEGKFESAKAGDLAWLAKLRNDYGGAKTKSSPLFDNAMRTKGAVARVLGYDPGLMEGEEYGSRSKTSTHVKEIRPIGPRRIVKWFQDGSQAADELFMRRVFKRFSVFSKNFDTADAVGYRSGASGRAATLVMSRAKAEPDGWRFTSLNGEYRRALAITQVFGMNDFNPGSMLFSPGQRPVVIDFERIGETRVQTGRLPTGLITQELPWVTTHLYSTLEEYTETIESFRKEFSDPTTQRDLLRMLRTAGHSALSARARLKIFRGNMKRLEAVLQADIDLANQTFEKDAEYAGLTKSQTRSLSDLNRHALDGDNKNGLRNLIRALNAMYVSREDEGTRLLAPRAVGSAISAKEFAYLLKKTNGGIIDDDIVVALAAGVRVPNTATLRRLAHNFNNLMGNPTDAPSIPPATRLSVGRGF